MAQPIPLDLVRLIRENVRQLEAVARTQSDSRGWQDRLADVITLFSGSMLFVWMHVVVFAVWIGWNVTAPRATHFDPYPYQFLTLTVSLEAIFLATFVLISQNRSQKVRETRWDLDLQTNLLAEEKLTYLLGRIQLITEKLGIPETDPALALALRHDTDVSQVCALLDTGCTNDD